MHRVPEPLPVHAQKRGMREAGQFRHLLVRVRQLRVEAGDIFVGGDAIVFGTHDQYRAQHFFRIDQRQFGDHINVGAVRHRVAVFQFGFGDHFTQHRLGRTRMIAGEYRGVELGIDFPHIALQQFGQAFGALLQRRRILAGPDERIDDQFLDMLRMKIGESPRAQCARRLAEKRRLCFAGDFFYHRHCRREIFHAAMNIRKPAGAIRVAIAFVIHRPHVVSQPREMFHERIIAAIGH